MPTGRDTEQWMHDERLLASIGAELFDHNLRVEVRIPRTLAEDAVKAWERDEVGDWVQDETPEQTRTRHRAGTLGLIGLSIQERGRWTDDVVVVDLDSWFIGLALEAADDAGLIRPGPPKNSE